MCYSTKPGTRRWPVAVFSNIIDIAALNSYIIAKEMGIAPKSRRYFIMELAETLCKPLIEMRKTKTKIPKIIDAVKFHVTEKRNEEPQRRTTCRLCKSNKTKSPCVSCQSFVCGSCSKAICTKCISE